MTQDLREISFPEIRPQPSDSSLEHFIRDQFLKPVKILQEQTVGLGEHEVWQAEVPFREQVTEPVQKFTDWFANVASPSGDYRNNGKFTWDDLERTQKKNRADSKVLFTHSLSGITAVGENEEMAKAALVSKVRANLDGWTQKDAWDSRNGKPSRDVEAWKKYVSKLRENLMTEAREKVFGDKV